MVYNSIIVAAFLLSNHNNDYIQATCSFIVMSKLADLQAGVGLEKLPRDVTIPFHLKEYDEGRKFRW